LIRVSESIVYCGIRNQKPDAYNKMTKIVKTPWSKAEDELVRSYVEKYGEDLIAFINYQIKKEHNDWFRTTRAVKQRWFNHLRKDIKKEPWTQDEINVLF
jgi:hypothetical protein